MTVQLKRISFSTCNENPSATEKDKESCTPNSKRRRITSISTTSTKTCKANVPLKHLQMLLRVHGINRTTTSALSTENYFIVPTENDYSSYQNDVITALRQRDIGRLRTLTKAGRSLQCCNQFGESLIHMACRRSLDDVVLFLIEAGVSLKVRDDFGRTPLHDAFWTAEPNRKLVKILISHEPSLLFISDKRGHTPLDYTRQNDWESWNDFLTENCEELSLQLKEPNLAIIA